MCVLYICIGKENGETSPLHKVYFTSINLIAKTSNVIIFSKVEPKTVQSSNLKDKQTYCGSSVYM